MFYPNSADLWLGNAQWRGEVMKLLMTVDLGWGGGGAVFPTLDLHIGPWQDSKIYTAQFVLWLGRLGPIRQFRSSGKTRMWNTEWETNWFSWSIKWRYRILRDLTRKSDMFDFIEWQQNNCFFSGRSDHWPETSVKGLWHKTFCPFLSSSILNQYYLRVRWRFFNFSFVCVF